MAAKKTKPKQPRKPKAKSTRKPKPKVVEVDGDMYLKLRGDKNEKIDLPTPGPNGEIVRVTIKKPSMMDAMTLFEGLDMDANELEKTSENAVGKEVISGLDKAAETLLPKMMVKPRVYPTDTSPTKMAPKSIRVCDMHDDDIFFLVMHAFTKIGGASDVVESFQTKPAGPVISKPRKAGGRNKTK